MTLLPDLNTCTVSVIGLGYVGLPLAVEFAKFKPCWRTGSPLQRRVIGFDVNKLRLEELRQGIDRTKETSLEELKEVPLLEFTDDSAQLALADVFLVTVLHRSIPLNAPILRRWRRHVLRSARHLRLVTIRVSLLLL